MNDRSLEAFDTIDPEGPMTDDLLAYFKSLGPTGAHMQAAGKAVGMPPQTSSARGAELKGVTPGKRVRLVRTDRTASTENGKKADVLVHYSYASAEQLDAHVEWVRKERTKRINDCQKQILNLQESPIEV